MKITRRNPSEFSPAARAFLSWVAVAFLWTALCTPALLHGQMPDSARVSGASADLDLNTMKVAAIRLEFQGARNVSDQNVRGFIQLREGEPYSQILANRSLQALNGSGNFDYADIRYRVVSDTEIEVIFVLKPKYRIGRVRFEGLVEVDQDDLEDEIESAPGLPLNSEMIKRDSVKIFEYLQDEGFPTPKVDFEVRRDDTIGFGDVLFKIDEGPERTIDNIEFEGNDNISSGDLRGEMETGEYYWLWSWITGSGKLRRKDFEKDIKKLIDYYKNEGFLDVEIPVSSIRFEYPEEDDLDIVIVVKEGPRYYLGDISFEGNTLFETDALLDVLDIDYGQVYSPERIEKAIEQLKDHYGQYGYLDTFITVKRSPDMSIHTISIRFKIREGDPFRLNTIAIQGNVKTKTDVIIRELALAPGDVFDLVRMKSSEGRLKNTRFFEEVKLSPEETNLEGRRNLRITVKEAQTGNLSFGAGFSSIESIVAFVEFQQSNFDLYNPSNYFQGGGQKFRTRLSVGSESNSFVLAFEEPWVFQRRLAFGFELFRNETSYLSSNYNELRMGVEFYLRKRIIELIDGRLSYSVSQVEIMDVSATAPRIIREEEGSRSVSKAGFRLDRDTRDRYFWTRSGSKLSADYEVAGLGGQTYYVNQEYRGSKYFLFFEDPFEQTLEVHGRAGTIVGYNNRSVPFFDKYYLGGPYTLRGFGFRDVGPKDPLTLENIGGNSMGFGKLEYTVRFVEPFGMALFYDAGFVNDEAFDLNPGAYNDNWGVGVRIDILGAPLNVDFGFPITSDEFNNDGAQFNFSFGTVF